MALQVDKKLQKQIKLMRPHHTFTEGDKVEIVGNKPKHLVKQGQPLLGTVKSVDGYYIVVSICNSGIVAEYYPNELKHLTQ